jgi:hypothetical protein
MRLLLLALFLPSSAKPRVQQPNLMLPSLRRLLLRLPTQHLRQLLIRLPTQHLRQLEQLPLLMILQ